MPAKKSKVRIASPDPWSASCYELELALREWYGDKSKWNGSAGWISTHTESKEALRAMVRAFTRRMTEVEGVDARLARRVECEVAALKTAIGKLKADGSGSTTVVARLSRLLAVLLGFDWHLGKPNRQLRYSQNRAEIAIDDTRSSSQGSSQHFLGIEQKRSVAIAKAHDDGLRILEIALVFNVSEQFVTDTLRRAGKIT